jgi:uncharacterized membrane protein YhiD involved in acid resistance
MTEHCAGHNNIDCRKELCERMDDTFIRKPNGVGRWVIGGVCSIFLLIAASIIGFTVHYVQAESAKVYQIDKTQMKLAEGFQNMSDALKKIVEVNEKLNDQAIRNEEHINTNKATCNENKKKLEKVFDKLP